MGGDLPNAAAFGAPLLALLLAWAICASAWTYAPFRVGPRQVQRIWLALHLLTVYSGTFFVAWAAVAGAMFLLAQRRLRRKAVNPAAPLASLETLENVIVRTSALGFALLTLGLASGVVIVASGPSTLGSGWWYSSKVLLALVVWVIYALLMNLRHARAFRGARAAWLSLCGLVLLLATFALANAVAKTAVGGQDGRVFNSSDTSITSGGGDAVMAGLLLGAHVSIAGGMHNALIEARRLRMTCLQVFTKNQRQWRSPPLTMEQVKLWQAERRRMTAPVVGTRGT